MADFHHPPRGFDAQAATYDTRAGLPAGVPEAVAAGVAELAALDPTDVVVEVAAGTGQIGIALAAISRYVGLDLSANMLALFQERTRHSADDPVRPLLIEADGDRIWPVADRAARAVFSSRAIHLLDAEHVAAETARVAHPDGAVLILGRMRRDPTSARSILRREMHRRLAAHGIEARDPERHWSILLAACRARGGQPIAGRIVARWSTVTTLRRVIDGWAGKPGLGGADPPADVKQRVLAEVAAWAAAEYGNLEHEHHNEVEYALDAVRFPAG